jgi:hypothetical protein
MALSNILSESDLATRLHVNLWLLLPPVWIRGGSFDSSVFLLLDAADQDSCWQALRFQVH